MSEKKTNIYTGLIQMILKESDTPVNKLIVYTVISGIINAVILSILNSAANSSEAQEVNYKYLLMFIVTIVIFFITKRYILKKSVEIVESSIFHIRMRLLNKLRKCELPELERIGKGDIFTRISHDANFISQSAAVIVNALQACVLVFFTLFYIMILSVSAFVATVVILYIAIAFYLRRQKVINQELQEATDNETELYNHIEDMIEGFKEIKINPYKNNQFFDDISATTIEGKAIKVKSGLRFAVGFMFSEMVFYLLLATIVFVLPQFDTLFSGDLTRITAAILFIIGPLENIVTTIPMFIKANVATKNIQALEERIESVQTVTEPIEQGTIEPLQTLNINNASYKYINDEDQSTFKLGPVNLTINKGELICIIGGNGSGKSTFLKMLTSLYPAQEGSITYNGKPIEEVGLQEYRSIFSVIFTDFHLFPKIYGVPGITKEKVLEYIKLLKMENKTSFDGENFTNLKLSTGQRKRLALICVLLEDKPFLILDEVTADQDPDFKKFFYTEILPDLKKKGKTIIMVSHDDKYFDQFDKVIKMEYGKVVS